MRTSDESNAMFCSCLLKHTNFDGKRILDIGCGNGDLVKYIARNYSPASVIGVEPFLEDWGVEECEEDNWCIVSGNAHNLAFDDECFDLVISFSTFEHIADIRKALSEIRRVLRPFGKFYTEFMPIWTSAAGHHFVDSMQSWWNPEHITLIPPWGHLYMSEKEMHSYLVSEHVDNDLIEKIVKHIYHTNIINRYTRTDLVNCIMGSGMVIKHYEERISFNRLGMITGEKESELTDVILQSIQNTPYLVTDLGVVGMRVCLEKYKEIKSRSGGAI